MTEIYAPDRATYLGGSDIAAILGVSPWKSAFMLYQSKIGGYNEEITPVTPDKKKLFARGKRWEPIVVEMLIDELRDRGHDVEIIAQNQRYQDTEYPFLAAEIDLELLVDGEEVNAEAKTVNPFAAKFWGEQDTDNIPVYYAAQVMYGMMIKPRKRCIVAALTGFDDKPRIHFVERDEEIIAGIRSRALEFWNRVQTRTPPEPTTLEDIAFLYPRDDGNMLEADAETLAMYDELKLLRSDMDGLETEIEGLKTKLKLRMGDASALMLNGKPLVTWKSNKDSQKTDWKAVCQALNAPQDVINQFTKTTPGARPMLIK